MIKNQFLRELRLIRNNILNYDEYPFNIPSIKSLTELELHLNVTFIIGENGTGKSTLLEAIAVAYGFNPEGGSKHFNFETATTHSELYNNIKIVKGTNKPKTGYFFRAESYYNLSSELERLMDEDDDNPFNELLNLGDLYSVYGEKSLHEQSHGESFISLFLNRFCDNGLYILDEPESALSPTRQMTFIAQLHKLVKMNCQFVIATHSPIIMAYPNAKIYKIDTEYNEINYKESDHYCITKEFLNKPEKMIEILIGN